MSEIDTAEYRRRFATSMGHIKFIRELCDEIDRLRAERDAALERLGECHAGYETMERQLAAARADALEEAAKIADDEDQSIAYAGIALNWAARQNALKECAAKIRSLASCGGKKGNTDD